MSGKPIGPGATAIAALIMGLAATAAQAQEGDGRLGVAAGTGPYYGVTLDAPAGPLRVRGDLASFHGTLGWAAGLEWPWALPAGTLGPVLGLAQTPSPAACPDVCPDPATWFGTSPLAALVGVSYRASHGPLWFVLAPAVTVTPRGPLPIFDVGWQAQPPFVDPTATWKIGPPWLEVGYRVTPWLDVSLRTTWLPVAVSWRFGGAQPRQEPLR